MAPAVQTSYPGEIAAAYAGMIADTGPNNIISRTVETAAIGFGLAVKQGADDYGVEAATAQADVFRGITVRVHDQPLTEDYAVGQSAALIIDGVVWVTSGAAVSAGDDVYMVAGDGRFTNVVGTNLPIPGAVFESSTAGADELVKVRLNGLA